MRWNIGVESLDCARVLSAKSSNVFLEVKLRLDNEAYLEEDHQGRKLVNLWLQFENEVQLFS